ncbi:MAG: VWA domain-containing protein [Myxococcales bacterium]
MKLLLWLMRLVALVPALVFALEWLSVPVPYLRLTRPVLAVPIALLLLWLTTRLARFEQRRARPRALAMVFFTGCAATACALAVLGVELGKKLDRLSVIVAVDRSRSIDLVPGAQSRVEQEIQVAEQGMRDGDRIGTLAFAADAVVEDPLRERLHPPAPQRAELARDGTDLGAAIRRGLSEVPPDSAARIVLMSDGVSTRGDALGEAALAAAAGVRVDVVPLDQRKLEDIRVVAVSAGGRASEGEAIDLRIVTSAAHDAQVEVRVYRDGELVRQGDVSIAGGEDVVHLREIAADPGLHRYDVELTAKDQRQDEAPEDNRGSAFVRVTGEASALVLERDRPLAAPLVHALESAAFKVRAGDATQVPADAAGFALYDLVVLSDISAVDLSPAQIAALASYVRDLGGGLLLMGGDRSLGPGGYGKTPLEEVSPVSFDVKQERRRASLAEVIAVDISGSMGAPVGSGTKLDLANEAAVRSMELLGAGDRLGVMHVDTAVQWTIPLGEIKDREAMAKAMRAVGVGGGGIYVDTSLQAGYAALAKETVQLKHLLLFADGSDAEERTRAFSLVSGAKARGITTSVVALGNGSDVPDLERMSKLGDGRFYLIEDATRLPAVFAQETVLAARSAINEVPFRPAPSAQSPVLRGIDFGQAPNLTGYVVTIPKGRAQVMLTGPEGDPVLASWSVGVGRSAVFTSDFKDRWGQAWTGWAGAERLFGQLARELSRRADNPHVRLEADTSGGELRLRASVTDDHGRSESLRRLMAKVTAPDGTSLSIPLDAVGAGLYSATVPATRPGAYVASLVDEQTQKLEATTGAVLSLGDELRPTGTDRGLLRRIAEQSGGKVRDTLAGVFLDRDAERFAYTALGPWLLCIAAFGLLLAVSARRLSVPQGLEHAFARWRAPRDLAAVAEAAAPTEAAPATAIGALKRLRGRKAAPPAPAAGTETPPPSLPRFSRPPPLPATPKAIASGTPPAPRTPPVVATARGSVPPASPARQPTAAEILLARRRGRKS